MKTTKHRIITKTVASIPEESTIFITRLGQIADRVEALLEQKEWTQKDLAQAMGKRESEVSKWLNTPHNLTLKSIAKMEVALGDSIIQVFHEESAV